MKLWWKQSFSRQDIYRWLNTKGYEYLKHFYKLDPIVYRGQVFIPWQLNLKKQGRFENYVILEGISKSFDLYIIQAEDDDLFSEEALLQFIEKNQQPQFDYYWSES